MDQSQQRTPTEYLLLFYTPEAKVGEPISIDFCYMKLVTGTIYPFNDISYGNTEEVVVPDNSGFLNSSILSKTNSPQWVASVDGRPAYSFNGVNQVIRSNRRFYTPVNQLTLTGWVYPTGTHANDRGVIIQQNFNFYLTLTPDQKVSTYWYQTSPEGYHTTDVSVPLNQWSLVVAVWDGERHQIFLNSEKSTR